jgi:hypothetical protein
MVTILPGLSSLTPWPESASELYWPSHCRLSTKLVPTLADRVCCVVSEDGPYNRILGFLDRSSYFFFRVAPPLYSRGWVDAVPDQLFLRKSGSAQESNPGPLDLYPRTLTTRPQCVGGRERPGTCLDAIMKNKIFTPLGNEAVQAVC